MLSLGPGDAMDSGGRTLFLGLICAQAAHSVEEYAFRLYDVLPPARMLSDLLGRDRAFGFAAANAAIVGFGAWCWLARVRPARPSARAFAFGWAVVETANGIGHLLLALGAGGYFPGALTAPLLLAFSVPLLRVVGREAHA